MNRKRGRPKITWTDNVTSWMGLKLEGIIWKAHNKQICMENDAYLWIEDC